MGTFLFSGELQYSFLGEEKMWDWNGGRERDVSYFRKANKWLTVHYFFLHVFNLADDSLSKQTHLFNRVIRKLKMFSIEERNAYSFETTW